MGKWLQYQRIDQDEEGFIMDSAVSGKLRMNYRLQVPSKTIRALGFEDIESLHLMLEEIATPAVAPYMNSFAEEAMNRKSAIALYDAFSDYFVKKYRSANPVSLYKGKVTKGRVKTEVFWLRVGKVFVIPAYQIFNGGLNVHLYFSTQAMRGFPADTASTQAKYDRRDHAMTVKGIAPTAITSKAKNTREFALALAGNRRGQTPKLHALPAPRSTRRTERPKAVAAA